MGIKEILSEDQNYWNLVFSVVFIILFFLSAILIFWKNGYLPNSVSLLDFWLITLATFRVIRLLVYDRVTNFVRAFFGEVGSGPRKTLGDLLACPWCTGIWAALFVVSIYFIFSFGWYLVSILAVAGLASVIQIASNLIGWKAELSKEEALGRK